MIVIFLSQSSNVSLILFDCSWRGRKSNSRPLILQESEEKNCCQFWTKKKVMTWTAPNAKTIKKCTKRPIFQLHTWQITDFTKEYFSTWTIMRGFPCRYFYFYCIRRRRYKSRRGIQTVSYQIKNGRKKSLSFLQRNPVPEVDNDRGFVGFNQKNNIGSCW